METKYCRTCALLDPKLQKCRMFGHQVEPAIDFCSKHTTELVTCELCGEQIPKRQAIISVTKGKVNRLVCERCSQLYGTCHLCKNSVSCSFETDPSPLPKIVQKQIRQGNMITMTQVRNPERIEITCKKGCPCYDSEGDCARQFGVCERCDNI